VQAGEAAIELAVEEACSSEECVYEVDEAVFPDVSKAETRCWQWLCGCLVWRLKPNV
jgi:hypothetical protein